MTNKRDNSDDEALDGFGEDRQEGFDDHELENGHQADLEDYNYDEADPEEGEGMSFLEHLEEFRWTVARSLLAFVIGIFLATVFIGDIAAFLKLPIVTAYGSVELADENLITYRPMGVISVFIQIAFLSGLTLSMPFALYFLAAFVAPGLTEQERKVVRPACMAAFLLFLTGVAFAFFAILPLTLSFSVRLNMYFGFDLFWAASDYYSMVVWFSLATGAFFQFPLIIVILVYLGVLPVEKLKSIRRAVFVGLMIFAAFLTPGGDFISLPLTTGFMYGLYELAIWVGARVEKKRREAELEDWDESGA
jgi:sec-independent protein translocase protein TatC